MTATEALEQVDALLAKGFHFSAHDRARQAIDQGVADDRIKHRAVLALARGGAIEPAVRMLTKLALTGHADPDIAALEGRLIKSLALASVGDRRLRHAERSAQIYEEIWRRAKLPYQGVNAATMMLLSGDRARSRELAQAVLASPNLGDDYWGHATRAEALLILGRVDEAARALECADRLQRGDYSARATTRKQLKLVAASLGIDTAVVNALSAPTTITYTGHMMPAGSSAQSQAEWSAQLAAAFDRVLSQHDVKFAYGGLASGADIVAAETVLARGGDLTVIIPFPRDEFIAMSVAPAGEAWINRFDAVLQRARTIQFDRPRYRADDLDFSLGGRRAMGLARLHAIGIDGKSLQISVWDGQPKRGRAGTAVDVATWDQTGQPSVRIACPWQRPPSGPPAGETPEPRQWMSVLFGDLPGFSRLDDVELDRFYRKALVALGRAIDEFAPEYRNAWGDAIQLAFSSVRAAAGCAARIQALLTPSTVESYGLPGTLIPRLAVDFGPVLRVHDPVQGVDKYAGRVMTRAARLEPVTPPGEVFVTEAFACELALHKDLLKEFRVEYGGQVPAAKGFGIVPVYCLRATQGGWK